MPDKQQKNQGLWWVPSLAFIGAMPYIVAQQLSTVLYKNLGISNGEITFYTSMLYLPWVIKPLWAPIIDMFKSKRFWVIYMQMLIGAGLTALAFSLQTRYFFALSLAVFWLIAIASATHDIAADGFYMIALSPHEQAALVGVRSMFFRVATIIGGGVPVILVGAIAEKTANITQAWTYVLILLALTFLVLVTYHFFILPKPAEDTPASLNPPRSLTIQQVLVEFGATFKDFFLKKNIWFGVAFILLFRLGEAQALKVAGLFMLDARAVGGLGLSNQHYGLVYSVVGIMFLTLGGLLGGYLIARFGLKKMLWVMVAAIHLPNFAFVFLAAWQPDSLLVIGSALAFEQFGYGFGFTAFIMYMMMISDGPKKTSHYALCTGLMAAGMMIPGAYSGDLARYFGYTNFFLWVCICTIPGLLMTAFLKIDPSYGKK